MKQSVKQYLRTPLEKHLHQFKQERLAKLPPRWAREVGQEYDKRLDVDRPLPANDYLNSMTEGLDNLLNIAADDDDIQELAKALAFQVRERGGWGYLELFDYIRSLCRGYAVAFPDWCDKDGILARATDHVWWLRNLRNSHAMAREQAAIRANIVHKKHDVYCSDDTLDRRTAQLARNKALLEKIQMQSESGQVMSLLDIAKTGMANQDNRRAELMTRITGFETLANEQGHKATFVTLTCPSRMHAMKQLKNKYGVFTKVLPNEKYDGTTPRQANAYLVDCWQKARRYLAHNDVKFYGLRVAEPHHDGTPHWHLILWYDGKPGTLKKLKYGITRYFVAADREEIWNDVTPRVKFVDIDESKGTAAGYVVKYVSKNLGGIDGEQSDEAGQASESLAPRVEAWASTWHIRQFQQVGGHFVTVWREVRRCVVNEHNANVLNRSKDFARLYAAAQRVNDVKADFAEYIKAMGGLNCPAKRSRYRVDDDFVMKRGRYGETAVRIIKGVIERFGTEKLATNREKWQRV